MLKGFHLTLMVGPTVPVPVPQIVLDALTGIEVKTATGKRSGFKLTFDISNRSPLHTLFLLSAGAALPLMRVIIIVTVGGTPEVLMDGVMTDHKIAPAGASGNSTLTVMGKDLTEVMNQIPFDGFPFPGMPPEARVVTMLSKYALFGVVPLVIPSVLIDVPIPTQIIPRQVGTDYNYIMQLADDVGYVFYINPGPVPGANIAYWGPEVKVGVPQPALNTNMDAHTNVESLSFDFDKQSPTLPVLFVQEPFTKIPIPIPVPDINPLNPPLGLISGIPTRIEPIRDVAKLNPVQALLRGLSKASRAADAVTGEGSLDVVRYGRVLKARQLVGVRGAGLAFDGLYYVESVTHRVKRGEYKQSFELSRNGIVSTVPGVPA
ncbi:MAG: hypothetical protein H0U81_12355 [Pyrinomonadaceae bacterium]|nr:hypothetical protein [Pyrinomonadaceae bacterium]